MSTKTWQEEFKLKLHNVYATLFQLSGYSSKQLKEKSDVMVQFITDLRKHDEEELIKIVDKLKLDVETRIAFKNLKPESVGYNKCALKVQIKIKQIKQLIKDYYQNN